MAKLQKFLQGHPNPAFSEKVQRGEQGKFLKDRPRKNPRLKGPKALWRKWHYPFISMHLNYKDWQKILVQKAAPKVPEWPSYGNFRQVTQTRIF